MKKIATLSAAAVLAAVTGCGTHYHHTVVHPGYQPGYPPVHHHVVHHVVVHHVVHHHVVGRRR